MMALYKLCLILGLSGLVLSKEGSFFDPCNKDDIECLSTATQKFLEKSCQGIPEYDIKAIDPLIIPSLNVEIGRDMGLQLEFKNINVTGLKNQKINDYHMDTTQKSVILKTKVDINIVSDLIIDLTKKSKSFTGVYTATATALGTSKYDYSLKKNNKDGLEYFEVGAETNTCEVIGEPHVTMNQELIKAIMHDSDSKTLKSDYDAHALAFRKYTICKILEKAYVTVIHNLRAAAKILPKSAFFNDI